MKVKKAELVYCKTCHSQEIRETLDHHLEMYCVYPNRLRVFQFHRYARSHLQFFHCCVKTEIISLEIISLDAYLRMNGYPLFNFGNVCWHYHPVRQSRHSFSFTYRGTWS